MKDKQHEFISLIIPDRDEEWSKLPDVNREPSLCEAIVSFDHEKERIGKESDRTVTVFHPLFVKI